MKVDIFIDTLIEVRISPNTGCLVLEQSSRARSCSLTPVLSASQVTYLTCLTTTRSTVPASTARVGILIWWLRCSPVWTIASPGRLAAPTWSHPSWITDTVSWQRLHLDESDQPPLCRVLVRWAPWWALAHFPSFRVFSIKIISGRSLPPPHPAPEVYSFISNNFSL